MSGFNFGNVPEQPKPAPAAPVVEPEAVDLDSPDAFDPDSFNAVESDEPEPIIDPFSWSEPAVEELKLAAPEPVRKKAPAQAQTTKIQKAPAVIAPKIDIPDGLHEDDYHSFRKRISLLPPPSWVVKDLIPDEGIALWHGQPRDTKSLSAIHLGMCVAAGIAPFGSGRFKVERPSKVGYLTEEDGERMINARMGWFEAAGVAPLPGHFFAKVRKGLSMDDASTRGVILEWCDALGIEVLIVDPLRGVTANSDKGPADLIPVVKFLRQIQNDTPAKSILICHHDIKPPKDGASSSRSRSHDASGGGIFSISDCPVAFEKTSWDRTSVRPGDYKFGVDPRPFEIRWETESATGEDGNPTFSGYVRPTAHTKDEKDLGVDRHRATILDALKARAESATEEKECWIGTNDLQKACKLEKSRDSFGRAIGQLMVNNLVKYAEKDEAKAVGWGKNAKIYRHATAQMGGAK